MNEITGNLEAEWRTDMAAVGADQNRATTAFKKLLDRHREPHRRYHGLTHLEALFGLLRDYAPAIAHGSPARLAVWWHDAVYEPKAIDNEQQSANLARSDLSLLGAGADLIEPTADLILKTKNHWESGPAGEAGDAFLDADIAILGAPSPTYDLYAAGVREEYAWAPNDLFRKGRGAFLRGALQRQRYFRTDVFEAAFGAQARVNLSRELERLEAGA